MSPHLGATLSIRRSTAKQVLMVNQSLSLAPQNRTGSAARSEESATLSASMLLEGA
jgi:hypothetical protein